MDSDLPDPSDLIGILRGGPTLNEIRGNTCDELRDELLTALIECDDYETLYARCMKLVERGELETPNPAEPEQWCDFILTEVNEKSFIGWLAITGERSVKADYPRSIFPPGFTIHGTEFELEIHSQRARLKFPAEQSVDRQTGN